jgi:hypothetical protein
MVKLKLLLATLTIALSISTATVHSQVLNQDSEQFLTKQKVKLDKKTEAILKQMFDDEEAGAGTSPELAFSHPRYIELIDKGQTHDGLSMQEIDELQQITYEAYRKWASDYGLEVSGKEFEELERLYYTKQYEESKKAKGDKQLKKSLGRDIDYLVSSADPSDDNEETSEDGGDEGTETITVSGKDQAVSGGVRNAVGRKFLQRGISNGAVRTFLILPFNGRNGFTAQFRFNSSRVQGVQVSAPGSTSLTGDTGIH